MSHKGPPPLDVGVLLADPSLPYSFSRTNRLGEEELEAAKRLKTALAQLPGYRFVYFDNHRRLLDDLRRTELDLVLNFCDTGFGNDWNLVGNIPSLLEIFGLPYTGSHAMAIDLASDKSLLRALAVSLGIPVPEEIFVDLTAEPLTMPKAYPALIKPNFSGGSFGMTRDCVVRDAEQAHRYLTWLKGKVRPAEAVIQEFLTGTEYTVGVVGNAATGFTVLPAAKVDYSGLDPALPPVLTYEAKFDPRSPYWSQVRHCQAHLDTATRDRLATYCTRIFRRLGFRDYARFDLRQGADGQLRLLDANPNPTWYWDSRMAMMAQWGGYSYAEWLQLILETAAARQGIQPAALRVRNRGTGHQH